MIVTIATITLALWFIANVVMTWRTVLAIRVVEEAWRKVEKEWTFVMDQYLDARRHLDRVRFPRR